MCNDTSDKLFSKKIVPESCDTETLFSLTDELEMRIAERTEILTETNRRLEEEIAYRKRIEEQLTETIAERDRLISEIVAAQEALTFQATHDGLTQLWNNMTILSLLKKELNRARRECSKIGVILCDVDHFKLVNDEYGHLAGDAVLRAISRNLMSFVRSYDAVGRYGGEEFLIILPGCSLDDALCLAERVRYSFEVNPTVTKEGSFPITLSMGVTSIEKVGEHDVKSLIRIVDKALYEAKRSGRNQIVVARPFLDTMTLEVPVAITG